MKKLYKKFYIFLLTVSTGLMSFSFATAAVVQKQTPINTNKGGTIWTRSFSTGGTSYNSVPVVTESAIYLVNENILYEMDLKGNIIRRLTLKKSMNSVCHMILENSRLYIPLSGGIMQCVDTETFSSLWISESFGGQSLSKVTYHNGYLYAGTTTMIDSSSTKGIFFCLNAEDGSTEWNYENTNHPGGYYWSGAAVIKDYLYFSGDNGLLICHSLLSDEVYGTWKLTETAKIRTGLVFDIASSALYTASNDGILYKISVNGQGIFTNSESLDFCPGAVSKNCTSTPAVWNNRLYIGSSADGFGYLSVIDLNSFTLQYRARGTKGAEIKSTPLVSAGYASEQNHNKVYVYVSYNAPPGGLFYLEEDETSVSGTMQTLYTPYTAKQFCLQSIVCGADGTLYYSNDSGTLFAVREVETSSDFIPAATATPSTDSNSQDNAAPPNTPVPASSLSPKKTAKRAKPKKPTNITIKIKKTGKAKKGGKKRTYQVRWKKNTKKSQTLLYIRQNSGSWKKHVIKTKSRYSFVSTKKNIRVRLRGRWKRNGKWVYSSYTKTKKAP